MKSSKRWTEEKRAMQAKIVRIRKPETARVWDSERRAENAKLIHNWAPWKKTRGPVSKEGKARVSQNATKSGWECKEMVTIRKVFGMLARERSSIYESFFNKTR